MGRRYCIGLGNFCDAFYVYSIFQKSERKKNHSF